MIWKEVIEQYGLELSERMKESKYLSGITYTLNENGDVDIPEEDIIRAYEDVTGKRISRFNWD